MRFTFGTLIVCMNMYLLQACASTQITPPTTATADVDIQRYTALTQQITLDRDVSFERRNKAQEVHDFLMFARQSNTASERQAYLEKAYRQLREISN